jgi:3'-5' exoribonuclease
VETLTIAELKSKACETPLEAAVAVQVQGRSSRTTRGGKPFLELTFADATGSFALKVWSDREQFEAAKSLAEHSCVRLTGQWTQGQYGIDAASWEFALLGDADREVFFAGDGATAATQKHDWETIVALVRSIADPRLAALCNSFTNEFGARFRRTAAARKNHHARRGGLVEHVAQMMRSADAISRVYPDLNRDLLIAAVLFHDCGKLWENTYLGNGFAQSYTLHGELLGHIPIGLEIVNKLWRDMFTAAASAEWLTLEPASEDVRLHLLHLVASHHGQYEFGSPTLPRTPEAWALHCIDNLDAKLEMMKDAYSHSQQLAEGIYERHFPLPTNLVAPLQSFVKQPPAPAHGAPGAAAGELPGSLL